MYRILTGSGSGKVDRWTENMAHTDSDRYNIRAIRTQAIKRRLNVRASAAANSTYVTK